MSIYEDLFGSDYRGNVPAVGIASAILGAVNANNLGKRASNVLEPNPFDKSFADQFSYYAQQLQALTGQMADVNNPQFKTRVQQRMDEIMRSHTDALRQQQSLAAQRAGRGLQGTFNPERRDEAMSKNLASLRGQAEAQARAEVMKELATAAQGSNNALQSTGALGLRGAQQERARQVTQQNTKDAYGTAGQGAYLALAKELLPLIIRGMDVGKAMDVSNAFKQGWTSDAESAASIGRPFTNPATSNWQAPPAEFQTPAPGPTWSAPQVETPNLSGAWDALPDFTVPDMGGIDPSDWWAQDSSVNWDVPSFDWGSGWGTGDAFGNLDYGQFF